MLKHLDLFSGIGGFSLGLESAGLVETVAFCDFDDYCQKILKKNFSGVPIYGDVKELNYERLKADGIDTIDIITGGYPCQPFSVAGRKKGEEDPRHVWPEMFRLIQELRPTWVIGENVGGHIKLGLDTVLENLESEGYSARTFSISASSVGANHKRERVWTLGYSTNNRRNESKSDPQTRRTIRQSEEGGMRQLERTSDVENSRRSSGREQSPGNKEGSRLWSFEKTKRSTDTSEATGSSERAETMADTQRKRLEGLSQQSSSLSREDQGAQSWNESSGDKDLADTKSGNRNEHETNREHGKTTSQEIPRDRGSISGVSSWWEVEPDVGRVAYGVSKGMDRLKCLGNSVVPQVPFLIGLAIKKIIENE